VLLLLLVVVRLVLHSCLRLQQSLQWAWSLMETSSRLCSATQPLLLLQQQQQQRVLQRLQQLAALMPLALWRWTLTHHPSAAACLLVAAAVARMLAVTPLLTAATTVQVVMMHTGAAAAVMAVMRLWSVTRLLHLTRWTYLLMGAAPQL
jgi:hypothetical protein